MSASTEPSSSSYKPSSSAPVAKGDKLRGPGGKLLVVLTAEGSPTGPNAATFTTRSSEAVRSTVPINSKDWRTVDKSFKDDIWKKIMEDFEFNVDLVVARPSLETFFAQRLRTEKYYYRIKILDKCESMQEQISKCPDGVDVNHWKEFVITENSAKVKERRKKNVQNRSKLKGSHTNGRRTYAQCMHIEVQKNPGVKIRRVDMWYKGQVRADGEVLESSKEVYEKVKAADERLKETNGETDMTSLSAEVNSDALHEVFGPEKKNRIRAVSSCISEKRLAQSSLAKSVLVGSSSQLAEVQNDVVELKTDLVEVKSDLKKLLTAFLNQQGSEHPPLTPTSRTEIGSTSVVPPHNINPNEDQPVEDTPMRPTSNVNPPVKLLNSEGMVVATGFVSTDGRHAGVCHGKKIGLGEKKIYIERVLVPETPIYDAPQNGCNVLEDMVDGGFIIWLECRLQY